MSYLGIYTNDLHNFDLSEHLKAKTIEELEEKKDNEMLFKSFWIAKRYFRRSGTCLYKDIKIKFANKKEVVRNDLQWFRRI